MLIFRFVISALSILVVSTAAIADGSDAASLTTAHGFLKRGLHELAETEYRRVLDDSPRDPEKTQARYGLAVCLVRQGRCDEAAPILTRLHRKKEYEFAADVLVMLAQCKLVSGEYAEAAEVVSKGRSRLSGHALADDAAAIGIEALYRAAQYRACRRNVIAFLDVYSDSALAGRVRAYGGLSLTHVGEDESAVEMLKGALSSGVPKSMQQSLRVTLADALLRLGKLDAAGEAYEIVRQAGGGLAARAALGRAETLWRNGDSAGARSLIDEALRFPKRVDASYAHLIRGRILFSLADYSAARSAFSKADALTSRYQDQAVYWTAKCDLRTGDAAASAKRLRKAIGKHETSLLLAEMRYDLAVALVRLAKHDAAIAALRSFVAKHGDHVLVPDALKMLASEAHQVGDHEASDAHIAAWREAKKEADNLPADLAFVHAENAYLSGSYDNAAARYATFLKTAPNAGRTAVARRRLGLSLYRLGNPAAAMKALAALGEGARTPATTFAIGDIHFGNRDWRNARDWLDRFIASPAGSQTDDALLKSGIAHMRLDEFETSLRRFASIIEHAPDSPHRVQALFETGQALVALDRLDEAVETFRTLLKSAAGTRFAGPAREHLASIGLRTGHPEFAAETFAAMADAQASDNDKAVARLRQGEALIQAERFEDAAGVLAKLLEAMPKFAEREAVRANYVLALARLSRCSEAIAQFDQIKLSKLDATLSRAVRYDRAWCLRKDGDTKTAARAFREILDAAADSSLGRHAALELAAIEAERGRHADAARLLESLVAAWRDDALPSAFSVDQVLYRLGKAQFEGSNFDAAIATLGDLLKRFTKSELRGPAAYLAGESAFRVEQLDRVIEFMEMAVNGATDADYLGPALLRLGDALARVQRWPDSEARFAEYLTKHPKSPHRYQAHFGVGWACENDGRFDEAIEAYRRATADHKGPTAARAQFQIGQCLFAQKQYDQAVRELIKTDILYAYPEWSAAALYEAGRCFERMDRRGEARQQFKTVVEKYGKTKWAVPASERLRALARAKLPGR